jgi:hypothetical protein
MADFNHVASVCLIELQPRPYEAHLIHDGEDWAGITDRIERKKLQNRLNKRICEFAPDPSTPSPSIHGVNGVTSAAQHVSSTHSTT